MLSAFVGAWRAPELRKYESIGQECACKGRSLGARVLLERILVEDHNTAQKEVWESGFDTCYPGLQMQAAKDDDEATQ